MNYYKLKRLVRNEIIHYLKHDQEKTPWKTFKNHLKHKYLIGDITISRMLEVYNVRENKEGELEHVTHDDGAHRTQTTQPEEHDTSTDNTAP